ncbi:MAG TPA: hypothetical protein VKM55_22090 [Candidatus Lokiarchaeia archaeon]|nr:hypothetical protein [Candidatus Lokiarchaeia archaeon]
MVNEENEEGTQEVIEVTMLPETKPIEVEIEGMTVQGYQLGNKLKEVFENMKVTLKAKVSLYCEISQPIDKKLEKKH